MPASLVLEGEFGVNSLTIGVPAKINQDEVEIKEILLDLNLNNQCNLQKRLKVTSFL